jgi:hypothetical protein
MLLSTHGRAPSDVGVDVPVISAAGPRCGKSLSRKAHQIHAEMCMRIAASPPTEQVPFFPCSLSRSVPRMYAAALQQINALVSRTFPSGRTTSIAIGRVFQPLISDGNQTSAFALHLLSMAGEMGRRERMASSAGKVCDK